ncbi:protein HEXIM1-like [Erpetoichthys calabaricus]|uniref:protein HEXIM1-like n=1 Tax=Erpetoichthys calabaricus TaxID=27687 RepID=UPI00109F182B|nr:protein HEXIM1-like [Erpetoichthys calabaricus]
MSKPRDQEESRGEEASGGRAGGSVVPGHLPAVDEGGTRGRAREAPPPLNASNSCGNSSPAGEPRQGGEEVCLGDWAGNAHPAAGHGNQGPPETRQLGKKKHRRRPSKKKRRWKPYFKLSWEEKKELDERETARASRLREEMFAKGLPVAPYNTTQFLMEDHDREEPDLKPELCARRPAWASRSEDTASEEDFLDPDEEDESGGSDGMGQVGGEFLQRDFSETYERYHAESLQNMSKQELIQEYLELEKCLSRLEEENNRLRLRLGSSAASAAPLPPSPAGCPRVRELETELERLRAQNRELLRENDEWRRERGLLPSAAAATTTTGD